MKAKDLIEELKKADPNANVVKCSYDCCGHDVEESIDYVRVYPAWSAGKKKKKHPARAELH